MKYLKRFNEELDPFTYRKAANKLRKKGHVKRADDLDSWSQEMDTKLSLKKWEDRVEKMKEFGTYKLEIEVSDEKIVGDFYLELIPDRDAFADDLQYLRDDGIHFWFGIIIIPTTKELLDKCINFLPDGDFGNGGFWGMSFTIFVEYDTDTTGLKVKNFSLDNYDTSLSGDVSIKDRRSANRFRKLIIDIFSDKNLNYPSGYTDFDTVWDLWDLYFGANLGLSGDYGWESNDIADFFKKHTSANDFYKN
jgi:hypothetical protein